MYWSASAMLSMKSCWRVVAMVVPAVVRELSGSAGRRTGVVPALPKLGGEDGATGSGGGALEFEIEFSTGRRLVRATAVASATIFPAGGATFALCQRGRVAPAGERWLDFPGHASARAAPPAHAATKPPRGDSAWPT